MKTNLEIGRCTALFRIGSRAFIKCGAVGLSERFRAVEGRQEA